MNDTKLVNLSGAKKAINPTLSNIPIGDLDDPSAGLVFLKIVTQMYPGITWGELMGMESQKMAGWWTNLKKGVGDIYDGGKDFIGDVVGGTGDVMGSAVRLATDEQVANTVSRAGMAYASGGASEGIMGLLSSFGGSAKQVAQKNPMLMYGAVGIGALVLIMVAMKD